MPSQQVERVHADAAGGDPADRRELEEVPLAPLDGAIVAQAQTELVRQRELRDSPLPATDSSSPRRVRRVPHISSPRKHALARRHDATLTAQETTSRGQKQENPW